MERGPFPGSILVAAAAVLAGLGFVGNKLYKAKAPEVRKVRAQLPGCFEEGHSCSRQPDQGPMHQAMPSWALMQQCLGSGCGSERRSIALEHPYLSLSAGKG